MTKKYDIETDIVIVGAGPAGVSIALFLSKMKIPHLLIDKARFPRDKICGDGLSGKVVGLLNELDPELVKRLSRDSDKFLPSWGVSFVAPNGKGIDLPFKKDMSNLQNAPGFVARRIDFDDFFIRQLNPEYTSFIQGAQLVNLNRQDSGIEFAFQQDGQLKNGFAKVIVGAEGTGSMVARKLAGQKVEPQHLFAGLRVYYENISDMHAKNFIELHFINEALPGYLWIFPLANNQANVGIGILSKDVKSKNLNLKSILNKAIQTNPNLAKRFKNATPISAINGWRLPLGSVKRPLSGERFILTGDAAALIDPFTGEGIGNAILSGKIAANVLAQNNFSANGLKEYDLQLYEELWSELQISYKIQRLVRYPWLFNFVINRLHNNQALQETFSTMFNNVDMRAKLRSPAFYLNMLFNRKGRVPDEQI